IEPVRRRAGRLKGGLAMTETRAAHTAMGGPAAWKGSDLQSATTWCHHLPAAEIAALDAAVAHVRHLRLDLDDVDVDAFPLPVLGPVIDTWAHQLADGPGFILVKGLPVARMGRRDADIAY